MAAISDSNFIVMSYSQDIKHPSKWFFTILAKKPEILDAAIEDNISKKKVLLQNIQGTQPDNSGDQRFWFSIWRPTLASGFPWFYASLYWSGSAEPQLGIPMDVRILLESSGC